MGASNEIHGSCDARFERVRDTFRAAFECGDEIGAAFCVTLDGKAVVDIWAASPTRRARDPGSATRS